MLNRKLISLDHLVIELQRLCQEKLSGILFISGDSHRTAKIGLLNGNIVALSCQNKQGEKALQLIREIKLNWIQFIRGSTIIPDPDLPSTSHILNSLISSDDPTPTRLGSKMNISQAEEVLKETLTDFMGPVAPMICKKVLSHAQNLDSAIHLLAQEIPDPQQANQFKQSIRQRLH